MRIILCSSLAMLVGCGSDPVDPSVIEAKLQSLEKTVQSQSEQITNLETDLQALESLSAEERINNHKAITALTELLFPSDLAPTGFGSQTLNPALLP